MPRSCELCHDNVASVFRPTIAICKPCKRSLDELASFDNECENCETCGTCGGVLNTSGTCPECWTRALHDGARRMVRHG